MLELPRVDGQQHALAETGQRLVQRRAVDGGVVAQQPLGELGGGRSRRAVLLDERGIDGEPAQRETALALGRVGLDVLGSISQRLSVVGWTMWPMRPACSASMKRSDSALKSSSTSPARASRAEPIALTLWRMRDSSSVGSGPRSSREVISEPTCVSPSSSTSIDMSVSSEIAQGSPPAMAIWAGVR